jgi:DNA primase
MTMTVDRASALAQVDLLALIGGDTPLRRVASTCGGEYAGPCPWCGGEDRFRVQPHASPTPRWMCRRCIGEQHWDTAIGYVMRRDGVDFRTACARLNLDLPASAPQLMAPTPPALEAPNEQWQARALAFVRTCQPLLWAPEHHRVLAHVRDRGLADETLEVAEIGYNPTDRYAPRNDWGLPPAENAHGRPKGLWLPRGLVIPWYVDGKLWKVTIRRPLSREQQQRGEAKYVTVPGSTNVLYGIDWGRPTEATVLVEGPIDALVVQQDAVWLPNPAAGGESLPVAAAACGTTGARHRHWISRLAQCPQVLIALDNDPDPAKGEAAAQYWLQALPANGVRWRPYVKDVAAMKEAGMDVYTWVATGLAYAARS